MIEWLVTYIGPNGGNNITVIAPNIIQAGNKAVYVMRIEADSIQSIIKI